MAAIFPRSLCFFNVERYVFIVCLLHAYIGTAELVYMITRNVRFVRWAKIWPSEYYQHPHWVYLLLYSNHVLFVCTNVLFSWWRHQMETYSASEALYEGNTQVAVGFISQSPVTRSFDVFFSCVWTNGSANNRGAGDLTRHRAHYNATVIYVFYT